MLSLAIVRMGLKETPVPTPTVDPESVTPGPYGFLVIVLLVVAVALLVIDMMRRVRRVRYRAEVNEMLDAEQRAAEDDAGGSNDGSADGDAGPRTSG
ncbi:MAG TPA: hypothetical protein H9769_07395 [Candidatus Microbacterium pullistercoris]|nr:hypothetical protein [Candidatus Microbacterium pullistercoris]